MTEEELQKWRDKILEGNVKRWEAPYDEGTVDVAQEHLGYFGAYEIISIGGKKTVIACDPRDAILQPKLAEWYDDAVWTNGHKWSMDTRFVSDPNSFPVLVKKDGKWAMVNWHGKSKPGTRLWVPDNYNWYDWINPSPSWTDGVGDTYSAVKDGKTVKLTKKGTEVQEDVKAVKKEVEGWKWDKDAIIHKWIEADRPCSFIHGFRFKGAHPRLITKEEALEKIKHHTPGMGYYSMEWTVLDGRVTLEFQEYSEGDML